MTWGCSRDTYEDGVDVVAKELLDLGALDGRVDDDLVVLAPVGGGGDLPSARALEEAIQEAHLVLVAELEGVDDTDDLVKVAADGGGWPLVSTPSLTSPNLR